MKKKLFSILCAGLMLTACGQQNKNETTMDFTDDVQVALADSGHIDLSSLQWTREPEGFEVKGDTILITTAPKTDLWQRTYYHFQNDNAPVLQMKTREKFFLPKSCIFDVSHWLLTKSEAAKRSGCVMLK